MLTEAHQSHQAGRQVNQPAEYNERTDLLEALWSPLLSWTSLLVGSDWSPVVDLGSDWSGRLFDQMRERERASEFPLLLSGLLTINLAAREEKNGN